ncbi:MAG: Ig-like domain-containing protein [Eubacterium sp.]|nr:Ig-like domain-containing protein [Eubacterium sp.]
MRESINCRVSKRFINLPEKGKSKKQIHRRNKFHCRIVMVLVPVLLLQAITVFQQLQTTGAAAKTVPQACLNPGTNQQFHSPSEKESEKQDGHAIIQRGNEIIILSSYKENMKIGETRTLIAAASGGVEIKWKSSSTKIAAVNPYGVITARKPGTCQIIAKTREAEAKCTVVVEPTVITLNTKAVSIENGATFQMCADTSNNTPVAWKSSKQSVAIISDSGLIQALKPGTSVITAIADGSKETCLLTVMKPTIKLSADSVKMYRNQVVLLKATVSSNREVTWISNRPGVATVNEYGQVTAVRHGEARIRATLDGVTRYCIVTVQPPVIRIDKTTITLKKGQTYSLQVSVSSGATPAFSSSSKRIATVSANGEIRAKAKGNCTISVSEDGTTVKCKIKVTE